MSKKKAVVLGATGMMGQKFVQLLSAHPWSDVSAVALRDKSVGKRYGEATSAKGEFQLPDEVESLEVVETRPPSIEVPIRSPEAETSSAPAKPIVVRKEEDRPQTRLDVSERGGMSVSVGRIRAELAFKGVKYIVLGHNPVRGGAGCSILNAELFLANKYIQ